MLSDRARIVGQKINDTTGANLGLELNAGIAEFVGWPFAVSAGRVQDALGKTTANFACVVHTAMKSGGADDLIPADNAAVVIEVIEHMGLGEFRAAYERIAEAKRLQKSPSPDLKKTPVATVTLTIIFAQRTTVSLEAFTLTRTSAVTDVTGDFCTRWNERESTWRKSWSCRSRGTKQSRS
jgi:hypothetical protein